MSIYIHSMEMPTSCSRCFCMASCRLWKNIMHPEFNRHRNCPLVPVPEHGRLIDSDALTGQMERNLWAIEDKAEKELGFDETLRRGMQYGHAVCVDAVNDAPIIIPADKEGEG